MESSENHYGYDILWVRISCKQEILEPKEIYAYSKNNEFISWSSLEEEECKPIIIAGSKFSKIPFQAACTSFNQQWQIQTELKKYKVSSIVGINEIQANPFEFEGKRVAVPVVLQKMISKTSGSFYSGFADMPAPDQIIVSGIPSGTHFNSNPYAGRTLLVLKGKGTIKGTNVFGARVTVPYFQYIGIIESGTGRRVICGLNPYHLAETQTRKNTKMKRKKKKNATSEKGCH